MSLIRLFHLLIFNFIVLSSPAQGFLKADGKKIVNNNGEIILRGMGLGGWMLQEPYMLRLSGVATAQYDIRKKITNLIGESNTGKFYEAWLSNHCTKGDIDSLASWGFNSVRLPMHYNLFTLPVQNEPIKGQDTWLTKGFQLTDSLLVWCKANKIYLILDLHAAPGGQGNDNAISDRDTLYPSLWQSEANRKKTIALWRMLATRYANEEWIGGYDLINEPNWGFQKVEDNNGCAETGNIPLKALLKDITDAIRKVDKKHIIYIEGNCWGNNYEGIFPLWDSNMVVSFHKYWNYTDKASIQKFIDYRDKFNVPIWMGETGENSNAWFTDAVSLFEKNKIGWTMWPLKKSGLNNPLQVKFDSGMHQIVEYWNGKADRPSSSTAFKSFLQYANNTHIKNNIVHKDVVAAMMQPVNMYNAAPYKQIEIKNGAILFAADYDIGKSGISYHDKDSAEYWVSTSVRTPWNIGGQYRNDGVDIEICTDSISQGYNIGWIQSGEWLQYSIYQPNDASYDMYLRSASTGDSSKVKIMINDAFTSEDTHLPKTGGSQSWKTTYVKNIKFHKGWNRFRIIATVGGFNLNYFQFTKPGSGAKID